jgi:hypothetical protein
MIPTLLAAFAIAVAKPAGISGAVLLPFQVSVLGVADLCPREDGSPACWAGTGYPAADLGAAGRHGGGGSATSTA